MPRRNTGTVHTGPGDGPAEPARLTRKLTLQDRHCSNRVERIKSTHPTYPARQNLAATSSLHNHSRCGLRSRLGVVHQHPSGSDSTRHSNQQPSEGRQVHSERANLWQVYSHQIVHRQAHRRPADALSCSCRCPRHAAACLRAAAAGMQTAVAWLCLSVAAACLSPATAHAATASPLRSLLPPLVLLLQLLVFDARTLGTAGARDRGLFRGPKLLEVRSTRAEAAGYALAPVDYAYLSTAPSRGREAQSTRMAAAARPLSDVDSAFLITTLSPPPLLPPPPLLSPSLPLSSPPLPLLLLSPPLSPPPILLSLLPSPFPFPSPYPALLPPISPLTPSLVEESAIDGAGRSCLHTVGRGLPLLEPSPRQEARSLAERRVTTSCRSLSLPRPPGCEKGIQSPLSTPWGEPTHTHSTPPPTHLHFTLHSHHHPSGRPRVTPGTLPRKRPLPRAGARSAHPHPLTSLSTPIITPPAAIVKPQGFFVRSFPPRGAAGAHIHLILSHASYHPLTCPIVHWRRRIPAAYHHWCRRCHQFRHDGAYDPLRHRQHRHAAGVALMSRWTPGLTSPLGAAAEGDVGYRTAQPPPSHPPSPPRLTNPLHTTHALTIHGPSPRGGQALPDHGIPRPHLIS